MNITSKLFKNVSWIFLGNVLHAVLQFLLNIIVARTLTENQYGIINYAISLVALFSAISTLGFNGIITKKFSEDEELSGEYLWSATITRIFLSIPFVIILQIISHMHAPENDLLHKVIFFQSLFILFSSGDLFIYWFRFKYNAKIVAIVRLFSFLLMAVWRIVVVVVFKNTSLYVLGTVLETAIFIGVLIIIYIKLRYPKLKFNYLIIKRMIKISYPFIFSAILATIYGQIDKIMLESMINTEAVAYYSVSLVLAGAIAIIPMALIEGFRPEILSYKIKDENIYIERLKQLYFYVFWVSIAYCTFITIFAKTIILIIYGDNYLPAVPSLSLIVWYTSFSYFGAINSIYMVAENKVKWVQVTTLIGAVINIILNIIFIQKLQVQGAALASLLTQIFTNFILLYLIKPLRKNFFIITNGIISFKYFRAIFIKFSNNYRR